MGNVPYGALLEGAPAPTASPATNFSIGLLCTLVRAGVRHIVLSPGSRSQALALVAAELERIGAVRLHVRIDERVAGFTALGIAVETGVPAAVITTSGTATANLHPAVLEARASGVPMILVTADRPDELRGIRSNQTTDQLGLYGTAVGWMRDVPAPTGADHEHALAVDLAREAWAASTGCGPSGTSPHGIPDPGPVQLNVAFREPLSAAVPDLSALDLAPFAPAPTPEPPPGRPVIDLEPGPGTVVIAGHGAGPAAEELAHAGGWPLLAEVSSGARFGPNLVVAYRELLRDPEFGGRVRRAVVFGHPTLSREVPALLRREDVESIIVAPSGVEFYNPGRRGRAVADVRVVTELGGVSNDDQEARAWRGRWTTASRALVDGYANGAETSPPDLDAARSSSPADRLAFARSELAAVRAPVTRTLLVDALWRFTWPHDRLVVGASRLIRELDRTVGGKKIRVHSNRGLAGIDGTVSTAVGIALAEADAAAGSARPLGTTRVLLGDLTLLHDVGSLALSGGGEERPRVQVVVGNDGGGTIFDSLEVAGSASADTFDRVLLTPQRVDLEALAAAFGWAYTRAATRGELDQALSAPADGPQLVEVPLPR